MKRIADMGTRETTRIEFDLDGNVDPETYHGMLDGKADEVLASFLFSKSPHVHARGAMEGTGAGMSTSYDFTGESDKALTYYGFPIDSVRVAGAIIALPARVRGVLPLRVRLL